MHDPFYHVLLCCMLHLHVNLLFACFCFFQRLAAYSQHSHKQVVEDFNDPLVGEYLDPHCTLKAAITGELKAKVESCRLDPTKVEKGRLFSRGKI